MTVPSLVGTAGLLGDGGQAAGAQHVDGGVQVAFGLDERLLALHHAGAGHLAELLDQGSGDLRSHGEFLSLCGAATRRAAQGGWRPRAAEARRRSGDSPRSGPLPRKRAAGNASQEPRAAYSAAGSGRSLGGSLGRGRPRRRPSGLGRQAAGLGDLVGRSGAFHVGNRHRHAHAGDDRVGDEVGEQAHRADGVVVGRDAVVHVVRVAVRRACPPRGCPGDGPRGWRWPRGSCR